MDLTKRVTAEEVAQGAVKFEGLALDGEGLYWIETRPGDGGRSVLVKQQKSGEVPFDVLPTGYDVRSRAHSYGGGAFVVKDGIVVFSNFDDNGVYQYHEGRTAELLTPPDSGYYADFSLDLLRRRVICVREQKRDEIVAISLDGDGVTTILSGDDFYASPQVDPRSSSLTWMTWNHPDMPWDDGAKWWQASFNRATGRLQSGVAGHLVRYEHDPMRRFPEPWLAEYVRPHWTFGQSQFAQIDANRTLVARCRMGIWELGIVNLRRETFSRIKTPFSDISFVHLSGRKGAFIAGGPRNPQSVCRISLGLRTRIETVRRSFPLPNASVTVSVPEAIEYPVGDSHAIQGKAYAFYYPPGQRIGSRPPLIVMTHGGPTGAASTALNLEIQYWTSRGFAVLDVNYGGSTGYGRAYRERLRGMWGIVDVADCVAGVRAMVERGYADPDKVVIRGKSAGGYTTLACLAFTSGVFRAGASHYGIGNLETLTGAGTDRFESHYLDGLVPPEERRTRSPLFHADRMNCPVIFFHGLLDKAVPPEQSEAMHKALKAKGIESEYNEYENEGHGFRHAENIADALEKEYTFYREVLGL